MAQSHFRHVALVLVCSAPFAATSAQQQNIVIAAGSDIPGLLSSRKIPVSPLAETAAGLGHSLNTSDVPATATKAPAPSAIRSMTSSVLVVSDVPNSTAQPDDAITRSVTADEIRSTAGAYSDIPRFLQTMAGVMFDTDARNTYMVNGGNPLENLYVVDGVEIPNINHISTANTSGGFVSMIDTDAVSEIKLHKMLYGSNYSGALSSVLEITTREADQSGLHGNVSLGYSGMDVVLQRSIGQRSSMMTEFRKSIINYFTDDIGFDGVPKYESVLSTTTSAPTPNDTLTTLYMQGKDELDITPNIYDWADPGLLNTVYSGNRMTMAGTWTHKLDEHRQQLFQFNYARVKSATLQTDPRTQGSTIYNDGLLDQPAILKYDFASEQTHLGVHVGLNMEMHGLNYQIQQPNGYPSPYTINPTPVDPINVNRTLHPLDEGAYSDVTYRGPSGMQVNGGVRFQRWGLNGDNAFSPMISLQSPSIKGIYAFGGIGKYSQLAPLPLMLGIAANQNLRPISDIQMQIGIVRMSKSEDRITLSAYRKTYKEYPVSTQFPSLSQADTVDPFSQPSFPMPMTSQGKGTASGVEAEFVSSMHRRAFIQANLSLQATTHQALDGVSRPSNFDTPVMANLMAGARLSRNQILTGRYSYHTGTPYTPFLFDLSTAQDRPIYDLNHINEMRGSDYARMDIRYEMEKRIFGKQLRLSVGIDNVLDRQNYYGYVFLPRCEGQQPSGTACAPYELTQQGRRPEGSLTYNF